MLFRRVRKHHHGSSNQHLPVTDTRNSLDLKPLPVNLSQHALKHSTLPLTSPPPKTSSFQVPFHSPQKSQEWQATQMCEAEKCLKKKYLGRKNVKKIITEWGMGASGFIGREDFERSVVEKVGSSIDQSQLDSMVEKYGVEGKGLNVKGLLGLLFMKSEGVQFNEALFEADKPNPLREQKINNLTEKLQHYQSTSWEGGAPQLTDSTINQLMAKINSSISRMKKKGRNAESKQQFFEELLRNSRYSQQQKQFMNQIKGGINYQEVVKYLVDTDKNVDNAMLDPILRKVKPVQERRKREVIDAETEVQSKSNTQYRKVSSKERAASFHPNSMLNKDQRKTRFGRSIFTSQSQAWFDGAPKPTMTSPDQKMQVLRHLQSQQDLKRRRYDNKLERIRNWKRQEQQNIAALDRDVYSREEGNIGRIRREQQAYNYVNFVKKRWE